MAVTTERAYRASHPWLRFRLDLRPAGPPFWMLLGEARSKVEHLARALLQPELALEMNSLYLAKGAHATTAIEGNALSEQDALEIVEGRHEGPASQAYLVREVQNIVDACNEIKNELIAGGSTDVSPELIRRFNAEVLAGLEVEEDVVPGEYRLKSAVVGPYRGAPSIDVEHLVDTLCVWLNGSDFEPDKEGWEVPFALLKAIIAHLYIAWIHPFGNGNGRTARLVELQILLGAGLPMPAAHLLSNHYNETRSEYYRQLEYASRSGGDVLPFLVYALTGFVDGIRLQLARVWNQQFDDRWEQFIYQTFGHTHTTAKERQRRLVLEMSKRDGPLPRKELVRLSPELYDAYLGTERMLSRDLNTLETMGLIERVGGGRWIPSREQLLAFQPLRRDQQVQF